MRWTCSNIGGHFIYFMKATPYADDDDVKTSAFAVEALASLGYLRLLEAVYCNVWTKVAKWVFPSACRISVGKLAWLLTRIFFHMVNLIVSWCQLWVFIAFFFPSLLPRHSGCSNWRLHWFGSLNRFEAGKRPRNYIVKKNGNTTPGLMILKHFGVICGMHFLSAVTRAWVSVWWGFCGTQRRWGIWILPVLVSEISGLGFANSMEVLADESRCLPWANGRARRPGLHHPRR